MNTKLTLSVDRNVVRMAKKYARANGTSVSNLVENYFLDLIYPQTGKYSDEVQKLIGMAKVKNPPNNYKLEKLKYLEEEYLLRN